MRKKGFTLSSFLALFFVLPVYSLAQLDATAVKVNDIPLTNVKTAPLNFINATGIITRNTAAGPLRSSAEDTGKVLIWLEHGNGSFTNQPVSSLNTSGTTPPFLMATLLYDTTKGKDFATSRYIRLPTAIKSAGTSKISTADKWLADGRKIKITPNVYSMVPGDTMSFAITYNNIRTYGDTVSKPGYYVFIYNKYPGRINPITRGGSFTSGRYPRTPAIDVFRPYNGETIAPADITLRDARMAAYNRLGAYQLINDAGGTEKNFFFSMVVPAQDIANDIKADTIFAVLFQKTASGEEVVLDIDILPDMRLLRSHDPNHLQQIPEGCIPLPKKERTIDYILSFQNLGAGEADQAQLIMHLPKGYKNGSLVIKSINFAGNRFEGSRLPAYFTSSNSRPGEYNFSFVPPAGTTLLGSAAAGQDYLTDNRTMGFVEFSLVLEAGMPDNVVSHAEIRFHSKDFPGEDGWEKSIPTNTNTLFYAKDCNCLTGTCDSECYKILGLCWWWWLLILLALLLLVWLLRRK